MNDLLMVYRFFFLVILCNVSCTIIPHLYFCLACAEKSLKLDIGIVFPAAASTIFDDEDLL